MNWWDWFINWLRRLFTADPGPVTGVEVMSNLRVRYDLPTTRVGGRELTVAEIKHVAISLSADGVTFAEVARVVPPAREYLQTDLDPGTWAFRLIVEDTLGQRSAAVDVSYTIAQPAPSPVLNATITEE